MDPNQLEEQQVTSSPLASGQISRPTSPKGSKKKVGLILFLVSLVLVGGAGFYFLSLKKEKDGESQKESKDKETSIIVEEKNVKVSTPTPTPIETVDKKAVSVQILNGTGIIGEAAYLEGKLNDLGYTSVKIGNASKQDYEATQVAFSSKLSSAVIDEITKELEKIYKKVETTKSSSPSYDVEIITGLREVQTPKPSVPTKATSQPTVTPTNSPALSPTPTTSL